MPMTRKQLEDAIFYSQQKPGLLAGILLPLINAPLLASIVIAGAASVKLAASGNKTSPFTASLFDVDGEAIDAGVVAWTLKAAHAGASIDRDSGILTLTDATVPAEITIVATGGNVKDEKVVTILAAPVVTTITVDGAAEVQLDETENVTSTYTASVEDQYGAAIIGVITWSLAASHTGVSINSSTGVLTAVSTVVPATVTVVATIGSVTDSFEVSIIAAAGA